MKFLSFLLLFLFVSCSNLPTKRSDSKLSILQGITNSKEVEFSVVSPKGKNLVFELRDEQGNRLAPDEIQTVSREFSDFIIHKMVFTRDSLKDYNLFVLEGEKVIDQRLIGRGQRESSKLRIAVASCMSDYYGQHYKIWDTLASKNPEYLLMIGDNVYADQSGPMSVQSTTPEILWNRYIDSRLNYPFFYQQKLIPTHAVWDDHDYGANNSDETFIHKDASKAVFDAFFAQNLSDDDFTPGLGVGGLLSLGDFNLYFLDARSFRSPQKEGSHLGLDQTAWFYSKLREEANPSFIIKGDQFFGGYHPYESFERNHPQDFLNFVAELKKTNTPFVFLSGDRHMSEIMHFPRSLFGKPSFEITSSPLHARTYENSEDHNPWRVVDEKRFVNFMLIDNVAQDNHWFMNVENIGENGETYFKRELAVYIKDLQDNLKEIRKKRRYYKRRYRKIRYKRGRR